MLENLIQNVWIQAMFSSNFQLQAPENEKWENEHIPKRKKGNIQLKWNLTKEMAALNRSKSILPWIEILAFIYGCFCLRNSSSGKYFAIDNSFKASKCF